MQRQRLAYFARIPQPPPQVFRRLAVNVNVEMPEDRFVFINMSKLREQSQLGEGPVVEEITPDGVVLTYLGTSFLLPRD